VSMCAHVCACVCAPQVGDRENIGFFHRSMCVSVCACVCACVCAPEVGDREYIGFFHRSICVYVCTCVPQVGDREYIGFFHRSIFMYVDLWTRSTSLHRRISDAKNMSKRDLLIQ